MISHSCASFVAFLVAVVAASATSAPVTECLPRRLLSNDDIRWDGNRFGLSAKCIGKTRAIIDKLSKKDAPLLLALLDDPNQYVAAHFALVEVTQVRQEWTDAVWNGLPVELTNSGKAVVPDRCPESLKSQWKEIIDLNALK